MEQHFEIESDSRKSASKARVCMCPAVTVTPSVVVRKPDSYVMCGECIHKRDARIWQPEDAGQSLFQCVVGTESEFNIRRVREALGRMVGESWNEQIVGDITVRDIIQSTGWSQKGSMESVVKPSHEGGETELILLAAMRG